MADTNIQHKDVGTQLSKTEWEAADSHVVTHSIADNAVVTVDGDPADNEFARWTTNGLEGRTYAEVLSDLGVTDAMVYKGVIDCSTTPDYPAADAGHVYKVSVAGKIGGSSGVVVEAGDTLLCTTDGTVSGNQATVGTYWNIIQVNIDGAVIGPASSTDNHVVFFDSTSGKLIKDSGLGLSGSNTGDQTLAGLGGVPTTRTITATTPITIAGTTSADLSADRTIAIPAATALVAGHATAAQIAKLDGIAAGANAYVHPNHSGDVTSVADGAQTIANGAVTLAKMANMATASLIYRKTAEAGAPEVNSLATLKTDLGVLSSPLTAALNFAGYQAQNFVIHTVADEAARNALTFVTGKVILQSDDKSLWIDI